MANSSLYDAESNASIHSSRPSTAAGENLFRNRFYMPLFTRSKKSKIWKWIYRWTWRYIELRAPENGAAFIITMSYYYYFFIKTKHEAETQCVWGLVNTETRRQDAEVDTNNVVASKPARGEVFTALSDFRRSNQPWSWIDFVSVFQQLIEPNWQKFFLPPPSGASPKEWTSC